MHSSPDELPLDAPDQRNWFMRHPVWTAILGFMLLSAVFNSANQTGSGPTSGDAGDQAAQACVRVVEALRDYSQGTRSAASVAEVAAAEEPTARRAAERDATYQPIASAIASLNDGRNFASSSRYLIGQCG